ncbi:MAG: vitamin K epoxide reductase family protein [Gemmatimonadaceae bacterium]
MNKRMGMALVSLMGLLLGVYLTLYHYGFIGTIACGISSCEKVQSSRWSMLLGFPVALWGAGFYASMLALSIASLQEQFADSRRLALVLLVLSAWGALFTGWLNYLEAFRLEAWCEWCLGSASMVLVLLVLSILNWRDGSGSLAESDDAIADPSYK